MGGLLAAWVGAWGAWLSHRSAGLTQTALDLALVSVRLPDVLYGRLGAMPDVLRASIGMTGVLVGMVAGRLASLSLRWAIRLLALLLILRLFPPYPDVLALWRSPDYGTLFLIATLALLGWTITLMIRRWPGKWQAVLPLVLGLGALTAGLWAFLVLRRAFATTAGLAFGIGWGLRVYAGGLVIVMVCALSSLPGKSASSSI